MDKHVSADFEIGAWDENPFDEAVGVAKLTRASVTKTYIGDIDATSTTEWLMAYEPDKSARFVGLGTQFDQNQSGYWQRMPLLRLFAPVPCCTFYGCDPATDVKGVAG